MMKNLAKRWLTLLCVICMCFTFIPQTVFADEAGDQNTQTEAVQEQEQETPAADAATPVENSDNATQEAAANLAASPAAAAPAANAAASPAANAAASTAAATGARSYTVTHVRQELDGTYNTGDTALTETETLSGSVGDMTAAAAKEYEGFTAQAVENQTIAETGDIHITVKYTRNTYYIDYDAQGGTPNTAEQYKYGSLITDEPAPSKVGASFQGWALKNGDGTTSPLPETMPASDLTAYAQWDPNEAGYTVVFWVQNKNDAVDAADDEKTYDYYSMENVPAAEIDSQVPYDQTLDSLDPLGFVRNDEKTVTANEGVTVKNDGSTVVNVYYDRRVCTFYFKWPDGHETKLAGLYGARIQGWPSEMHWAYDDAENKYGSPYQYYKYDSGYSKDIYNIHLSATETMEEYIKKNKSAVIHYYRYFQKLDGSWPSEPNSQYTSANLATLTLKIVPSEFTMSGYEFNKYSADFEQATKLTGNTTVKLDNVSSISVYYLRSSYNISFLNCENVPDSTLKYEETLSNGKPDDVAVGRPGNVDEEAVFAGWYLTPNCADGTEVDWNGTMPGNNVIYYAKWVLPNKTVHFENNGANEETPDITVQKNSSIRDSIVKNLTKPGYTFTGWYRDAECTMPFLESNPIVEDTTLYAGWTDQKVFDYSVRYVDKDGKELLPTEQKTGPQYSVLYLEAPEIDGYTVDVKTQNLSLTGDGQAVTFVYTPIPKEPDQKPLEPQNTSNTSNTSKTSNATATAQKVTAEKTAAPATGDSTPFGLMFFTFAASAMALAFMLRGRRREK